MFFKVHKVDKKTSKAAEAYSVWVKFASGCSQWLEYPSEIYWVPLTQENNDSWWHLDINLHSRR